MMMMMMTIMMVMAMVMVMVKVIIWTIWSYHIIPTKQDPLSVGCSFFDIFLFFFVFFSSSQDTTVSQIEDAFNRLTAREDVAIVLINQHVANEIRHVLGSYSKTIPTVLEIPSKDVP